MSHNSAPMTDTPIHVSTYGNLVNRSHVVCTNSIWFAHRHTKLGMVNEEEKRGKQHMLTKNEVLLINEQCRHLSLALVYAGFSRLLIKEYGI